MAEPSRNVELKAHDPDPARTLERALAAGAEDRGVLRQRDTYFAVAHGRLKLREEEPGGATLIAYERPDAASERVSRLPARRRSPSPPRCCAALSAAIGVSAACRQAPPPAAVGDGADPSRRGPRARRVPRARGRRRGRLRPQRASATRSRRLRELLEIADDALREGSYADALTASGDAAEPDPELLAMAREAAGRAYAPYSGFPVGAAVRTADGRRYAGANVENAAYPQGQCAEASAIGALVAGGGGAIAEVVVAAPSRELCTPCGGCRQRLREFTADDAPIHLADLERVRRTTTLAELLPLSFGPEHLSA